MARGKVLRFDRLGHRILHRKALQVVVDVLVADSQIRFVGLPRIVVEKVCGGLLLIQALRRTELDHHGLALPLREPGQRHDIRRAVAELREKPGDRLRGMVRADDEQRALAGNRELGDHARARLHVAFREIHHLVAERVTVLGLEPVDRSLDVEGDRALRLDELQGKLCVILVPLNRIRQTHRDEFGRNSVCREPFGRELAQPAGKRRILTATDAKHEAFRVRRLRVIDEETDARLDLGGRVDTRGDAEVPDDLLLHWTHDATLQRGEFRAYARMLGTISVPTPPNGGKLSVNLALLAVPRTSCYNNNDERGPDWAHYALLKLGAPMSIETGDTSYPSQPSIRTGTQKRGIPPADRHLRTKQMARKSVLASLALLSSTSLLFGCAGAPTTSEAAPEQHSDFLPCMVADTGGFNDRSFNESAHEGIEEISGKLGTKFVAVESPTESDYSANVNELVNQGCDLIITVGYLLADATVAAAKANPNISFAIIDDKADLDFDGKTDSENIKPILFDVAPAAFLAGYAAASYSTSGIVGTFAGMNIPPVSIFLDGYAEGVAHYNSVKGTAVKVLGWDAQKHDGLAIGSFSAGTEALTAAQGLIAQGADVIQSGGGTTFLSIIAAFEDAHETPVIVGGDSDMFYANPENSGAFLVSVLKGTKTAVMDVVEKTANDGFDNTPYVGTLSNNGVGISPFHDFESKIAKSLPDELAAIEADIIAGKIVVSSPSSPK